MPFSQDTFTYTNGLDLNAVTPPSGNVWIRNGAGPSNVIQVIGNRVRSGTANVRSVYYKNDTPSDADYSVFCDIVPLSLVVTSRAGVCGRMDTTADTYYCLRYDGANWQLMKRVAAVQSTLGSLFPATLVIGTTYRIELRMSGTSISAWVDGVNVVPAVIDSSITATGFPGILQNAVSPSDTTDLHIDNFRSDNTPGGDPSGTANQGSLGLQGQNASTRKHTLATEVGSFGLGGQNTIASNNRVTQGSVGFQGKNTGQKIIFDFLVAAFGLGGQNVSTRKHTLATQGGSLGFGGQNSVVPKTATAGSVGFQGQNTSTRKHTLATQAGSLGLGGQNTILPKGINGVGSTGFRGQNASTATRHPVGAGSLGTRGQNASTATRNATNVGGIGVSGTNVSTRHTSRACVGSGGFRGMNTATQGSITPTPTPTAPTPNNYEYEPDYALAAAVIWPDPSTLTPCT